MKIFTITTFILFTAQLLLGIEFKNMSAEYDIKYGIFGKVGVADTSLKIDNNRYHVKMVAKATGFAKILSNGKIEIYESEGIIKDGILIPQIFTKIRKNNKKEELKRYFFDHEKKVVTIDITKTKNNKTTKSKDKLNYYVQNDLLTLFFNLKSILGNKLNLDTPKALYAVGANKKDGKVDIYTPKGKELKSIKKILNEDENIFVAIINQKIFSSDKGELYLNLNDQGICTKALLKDVIMFGDIKGSIKNLKVN